MGSALKPRIAGFAAGVVVVVVVAGPVISGFTERLRGMDFAGELAAVGVTADSGVEAKVDVAVVVVACCGDTGGRGGGITGCCPLVLPATFC